MQLTVCFVSSFVCLIQKSRHFFLSCALLRTQFSTRHWSTTLLWIYTYYTKVAIIIRIKKQESMKRGDHDQSTFFPSLWMLSFWLVPVSMTLLYTHTKYSKKQDRIHSTTRIHFIKTIYEPSYNPFSFREKMKKKNYVSWWLQQNMMMTDWLSERDCPTARIDKIK